MREILSLKLKRGEVSAVVGEDGPALDTVLEGPLLSVGTENKHREYRQSLTIYSYFITYMTFVIPSIAHCQKKPPTTTKTQLLQTGEYVLPALCCWVCLFLLFPPQDNPVSTASAPSLEGNFVSLVEQDVNGYQQISHQRF